MITTFITTYRRPYLLKRAVESVLEQTYTNFQLYVYDDASNDETESVMREFEKRDVRVKYMKHEKNIGIAANYAFALGKIDTPYFSFLSDDDYLLPHFYELALKGFQQHPDAALSLSGVQVITEKSDILFNPLERWSREGYFKVPEGVLEMISLRGNYPIPTGILFQTKLTKEVDPDLSSDIILMWDPNYFLQIAARYPIVMTSEVSACFLSHDHGYSSGFYSQLDRSADGFEVYCKAVKLISDHLMQVDSLSNKDKHKIKNLFDKTFKIDFYIRVCSYFELFRFKEACRAYTIFEKYFHPNYKIKILYLFAKLCEKVPFLHGTLMNFFKVIRRSIGLMQRANKLVLLSIGIDR